MKGKLIAIKTGRRPASNTRAIEGSEPELSRSSDLPRKAAITIFDAYIAMAQHASAVKPIGNPTKVIATITAANGSATSATKPAAAETSNSLLVVKLARDSGGKSRNAAMPARNAAVSQMICQI